MIRSDDLRGAIFREYKSITAFSKASGVPRATIDNLLAGRCEPSKQTIQAICDALHKVSDNGKFNLFFASDLRDMQDIAQ